MSDIERAIDWLSCERENYSKESVYCYYMGLAISALEKQLSSGWIPVSERLPENNEPVLLFLSDGKGKTAKITGYLYFTENEELKKFNNNFSISDGSEIPEFFVKEYVKAWQPLPEPYKEVENE